MSEFEDAHRGVKRPVSATLRRLVAALTLTVGVFVPVGSAHAAAVSTPAGGPHGRVVLRTRSGQAAAVAAHITAEGGQVEHVLPALDMVVATPTATEDLAAIDGVTGVQADEQAAHTGDFTSLLGEAGQWLGALLKPPTTMDRVDRAIGADLLWGKGITGAGVDVAVIDSGIAKVPGLDGSRVVEGPDLSFDSQFPEGEHNDGYGHGTHLAGIVAGNDGKGFKGVAPGARLVDVKVGSYDGAVDVSQVLAAIDWVVQNRNNGLNIKVINLSYGTDGTQDPRTDPLTYAVEVAWRAGITVVVAGGNDGITRNTLTDPAYDPYVIAVGADDLGLTKNLVDLPIDDAVAEFSSRSTGRSVDLIAPGVSIVSQRVPGSWIDQNYGSATYQTDYFRGSGTSQAAAVVSGSVALLLQKDPKLTPDQVKDLLVRSADGLLLTPTSAQGAGRIDVATAAALAPRAVTQTWPKATGTGSIEKARGSSHVADGGTELTGERDIMGVAWNGGAWAKASLAGTSWDKGRWNGTLWTGAAWSGLVWPTADWSGDSWAGRSWTGRSWTGRSWTAGNWTGRSWTGRSWTGRSWTGGSWQ